MPDPTREELQRVAGIILNNWKPGSFTYKIARALVAAFELIDKQRDALDWVASGMRDTMPLPEETCKTVDAAIKAAEEGR